jgi:excisionase family DNA binding protein
MRFDKAYRDGEMGQSSIFEKLSTQKRSLWNVDEVAVYLGVSDRTIRDLVYRRRIPFRKVGRCVRFSPEEIEQWTLPTKE